MTAAGAAPNPATVDQVAELALGYLSGAAVAGLVYLGDRLGLYRTLRDAGTVSSDELAARAKLNERWVREWLHAQTSAGLVEYAGDGLFRLTPEQSAVLADEENPSFGAGGFALVFPLLNRWEQVTESFRTGRGVPYNDLGHEHAIGEGRFSGPWVRANLVPSILPGLEGVTEKLAAGGRAVDVGCGSGTALVAMATAFPDAEFHGYDSAELAIRLASERVSKAAIENVVLHNAPASSLPPDESFDFVLTWDCLHDMTDPLGAMRAIRGAIKPDGTWLIVDINGKPIPEENFSEPLAGFLYSVSVLDCLACSTYDGTGAGLGTLGMPEPVARRMTAEAGFTRFTPRDFGNPLNAFYEVRP